MPRQLFILLALVLFIPVNAWGQQAGEWKIALAGDIMLGSDHPQPNLPANQGRGLLDQARQSLMWADVAIGNHEGTMTSGGTSSKAGCSRCYSFRTPPSFALRLREAGFDAMSMANNHARDFGQKGLDDTQQALLQAGIASTGWQQSTPAIIYHAGRKACLLAYAPNRGMNDIRNIGLMTQQVRQARTQCNLVIVSFHGGAEGADKTSTPMGVEVYLGENRGDVRLFSRSAIDAGAHLVFGHGPHVPRGMELYRGHLIAYSLGNFMTYGGMNVSGVLGQAPLLLVKLDEHGRLINGRVVSFRQNRMSPLSVDPDMAAAKTMIRMTQQDFDGGGLEFTHDAGFYPARN